MSEPVTIAAIDCGTNSIRLLIARHDPATGQLHELERSLRIVRLGYGVDATGRLDPGAIERTVAAAREYHERCQFHGVTRIAFIATSASRDAVNAADFINPIKDIYGFEPQIITGSREAELSFSGVVKGLSPDVVIGPVSAAALDADVAADTCDISDDTADCDVAPGTSSSAEPGTAPEAAQRPLAVVDLGGGSTEFIVGRRSGQMLWSRSLDIGSVRLAERYPWSDPPTAAQIAEVRAAAREALASLADDAGGAIFAEVATVIGVAGTVTTVTTHALGLPGHQRDAIHGAVLSRYQVAKSVAAIVGMTKTERRKSGSINPGRVDVIGHGAVLWEEIVNFWSQRCGIEQIVTSECDILDGIAWSLLDSDAISTRR